MALEPSGALSVSSLCASLRERYIYTVVSSELYSPEYYRQKGLSSAQVSRLYKTQAIVANTYYEYCDSVYSNHRGQGYKVCNTDCCQVCDSAKMNQVAALAGAQESLECGTAKVTGIVLDADTQKPVQGARIMVDGVPQVSTGKDGKFLIKSVRNGIYHWQVQADGYHRADYWNYSVYEADKKDIFTFLISKKKKISKDRYPLHAGMQGSRCF